MTTVAFDGLRMAADTLATDSWGMKEIVRDKIKHGPDFLMGAAGEKGAIERWWRTVKGMPLAEVLEHGYPDYDCDRNDPAIMLTNGPYIWRHVSGTFIKCSRSFHAIGSGRDYALAAMHIGMTSFDAVRIASEFDNGTGSEVVEYCIEAK